MRRPMMVLRRGLAVLLATSALVLTGAAAYGDSGPAVAVEGDQDPDVTAGEGAGDG